MTTPHTPAPGDTSEAVEAQAAPGTGNEAQPDAPALSMPTGGDTGQPAASLTPSTDPLPIQVPNQDQLEAASITAAANAPRARRFGPRRSRSASLHAVEEGAPAPLEPAQLEPVVLSADTQEPFRPNDVVATSEYAIEGDAAEPPIRSRGGAGERIQRKAEVLPSPPDSFDSPATTPDNPAPPTRSSRTRTRRRSGPSATAARTQAAPLEASTAEAVPLPQAAGSVPADSIEASVTEPTSLPTARRRTRSRRPRAAAADPDQLAGEQIAALESPMTFQRPSDAAIPVLESPVSTDTQSAETMASDAVPPLARARRSRRRAVARPEPVPAKESDSVQPGQAVAPTAEAQTLEPGQSGFSPPVTAWPDDEPMHATAPGGDIDGTEALARALLDMFPGTGAPSNEIGEPIDEAGEPGVESTLDIEAVTDETAVGTEQSPRRSRRGRRGGRGRRKGAAHVPGTAEEGLEGLEPGQSEVVDVMPALETAPAAVMPALTLFMPETGGRQTRSWRERGPQRRWDRVFPRETHVVTMPPPKPSHGARFAPIPQAVQPASIAPVPQPALPVAGSFVMPDLRANEPLGPGETRMERLLDIQTRLLQAMLEGQARQIESLSSNVASLYQTVRDMAAGGSLRGMQPRTAIFVDAPNVCYAAENARVSLDYNRMLKYLSRDRQLVHALSYSPIIDDVREGIRYETQRFVAPFLRAGYKLITKPLKRFSDGSAKGNFDLELALDILTMADRLEVVVLVSGDSDFECVIEHIQSRGVRVEVVAFASNVSTELVNIADTFIDIMQHIEHFRAG